MTNRIHGRTGALMPPKPLHRVTPSDWVTLTFIGLAAAFLSLGLIAPSLFEGRAATGLALGVIALAGLPHGTLDVHLAMRSRVSRVRALLIYGAVALVGGIVWIVLPSLLILIFLVLSVWHFSADFRALGRGIGARIYAPPSDGAASSTQVMGRILGVGVASSILLSPILAHPAQAEAIFALLMPASQATTLIALSQLFWPVVALSLASLVFCARHNPTIAVAAALAIAAGFVLPPICAFALYFCALHSPLHLNAVFRHAPVRRIGVTEAALYLALTLGLLAGLVALWSWQGLDAPMIRAVFGLLVILTLPHMAIVELWQSERARDARE